LEDYYVPASLDADLLQFKARKRPDNKDPKRSLSIPRDVLSKAIFKSWGVPCILVDDVKNSIFIRRNGSYESVGGYNAEAMSEKIDTALKKPPEDEVGLLPAKTFQILTLVGVALLGVGLYLVFQQVKTVDGHSKMLYDTFMSMQNVTASGG